MMNAAGDANAMITTRTEADSWLAQVQGKSLRNPNDLDGSRSWVVIVRTPGLGPRSGKLIVAFGHSFEDATAAAEERWQEIWETFGPLN